MLESENIEFKISYTDQIYKEVIAFLNTSGGKILVRIDDQGNRVGIENVDDIYTKITNGIRDNILPDATIFIKYKLHDDQIIEIEIAEGSNKPYYLKSKGLKSSGVFVRQGASKAEASLEQIRQMIKIADGDCFEEERSLNQDLSFVSMKETFKKYNLDFNDSSYFNLGLMNKKDDMYTNLALLVSDQCQHSIKIAVFEDEENTIFHSRKEFTGSLFDQLKQSFEFLMLCNNNGAVIRGLERIENKDYPEEAIREALLNAIVHRDYSFSGSIIVNVNKVQMEIISIGGLLPGLHIDDIKNGISQSRNKKLAEIFYRLRLIEAYGTGIRRIFKLYQNCSIQPELDITSNSFKIVLPNMSVNNKKDSDKLTNQEKEIVTILKGKKTIKDQELQEALKIKKSRSYELTKKLAEKGVIEINGKGNERTYTLK